ncbi:DNA-binding protein snt1 [Coemansia sp. RSA 2050]|nr:DNA-binding protein snt1 [Coemansia sp. RSA 2050]KAJ2729027.1 DNA-binding protein snt1 [Coemansia sp. BCRC 34962]
MSYNRQQPDSQNNSLSSVTGSGSGRYRGSGSGRDWEAGYRDRSTGRQSYIPEGGVARDRMRSGSVDRGQRSPIHSQPVGNEGRIGYSRSQLGRWAGHDIWHRDENDRERERSSWDSRGRRERDHTAGANAPTSARYNRDSHQQAPPPAYTSRHSVASFGRERTYTPPPPPPPLFSRRATEPSEVLEEGELEIDDRVNPNTLGLGSRTYTLPVAIDTSSVPKRADISSLGFRSESRRPSSAVSALHGLHQHHHSAQPRLTERKFSQPQPIVRPPSRPPAGSRNGTPSPKRISPIGTGTPRTPTPEPVRAPSASASTLGNELAGAVAGRVIQAARREPSLSSKAEAPAFEVQSRISDIDREIAECQERLVMMATTPVYSGAAPAVAATAPSTTVASRAKVSTPSDTINDRTVPTSPPKKRSISLRAESITVSGGVGLSLESRQRAAEKPGTDNLVPQVSAPKPIRHQQQLQVLEQVSGSNLLAVDDVFIDSDFDDEPLLVAGALSSDEDDENVGVKVIGVDRETLKDKLRSRAVVRTIYAENQARAAAVQATLSAPFLAVFPRFVPGAYPEPSDWPFWAENERSHTRTRPFLAAILACERKIESKHARELQEEYAELYARWRRRVDRLDRQREAKQRALSTASGTAGSSGMASGSGGGGSISGGGRRRTAGASVSAIATADEFGFSLGPLFSATPAVIDVSGRGDDGAFTSDAVHSEAELQAIIERLQHDDARSPDARSQRTAAKIPNMVVGARDRSLLQFANSSHLVEDPLAFYHAQLPVPGTSTHRRATFGNNGDGDHEWTQAEVSAFVAAYLTHPKEFGVIAACIPHKSMNACVQFYYRNKKQLRLKALEAKANRRARRAVPAARRRKDRGRDRRDRRAREERERIAAEAAASLAAPDARASDDDDDDVASAVLPEPQPPLPIEHAGALERRSRSSALLRSIVQASRRRKLDEAQTLAAPALPPGPAEDSEGSDEAGRAAPSPGIVSDSACLEGVENPRDRLLSASEPPLVLPPVDEEEDGELIEDIRWEPRRRSRQQSELNAYAMGGSIVRTRRSRGDSDQSLSDASDDSRASPAPSLGDANGGDADVFGGADGEVDGSMEAEEVVEVSGVIADRSRVRPFPRIVSRKSQSRFDVTLTAILDTTIEATQSELKQRSGSPPTESALDRFVTEELSAHRRPISSYETLLICSSAATNSPTRGSSSMSLSNDATLLRQPTQPLSAPLQTPLDAQVDMEAGPLESVLVGAAAWLRDDRRRVLRALHRLGADFAQVASLMPSKTMAQCRYFYYHYRTPAGTLISEVIPNALTAANASIAATNTALAIGSLVLPPLGARTKPGGPSLTSSGPALAAGRAGAGSDASHDDDADAENDSNDDDDETPLAAQLASALAAAAAMANPGSTHPPSSGARGPPLMPRHMSAKGSTIAQVPLDVLVPRMTPISSLVLPPKQPHASESPRTSPSLMSRANTFGGSVGSVATAAKSALLSAATDSTGSVGRSPSSPPLMTAKKSGYSSYWSVHERSAFMHYAVRLGQDWQGLADAIGSKTGTQVRNYFRANRERLRLDGVMAEFERNRAAGTLPPMTPFQPAPSLLPASPATAHTPSDDLVLRKEKRGRKRKNDLSRSSAEPSHSEVSAGAAKRPGVAAQVLVPMPNTAPASMSNFPTMGVDGGRAVVFARPVPPPPMARPSQGWAPPRPAVGAGTAHYHQPYLQHAPPVPNALPPLHGRVDAREYGNEPADRLLGVSARAESGTPSTQPTPPPLEGLPRFSSSPAPAQLLAPSQARHYPSMHISSLTSGGSVARNINHYSPPPPPLHLPAAPLVQQDDVDAGETRKVSVTKINALLNDDSPPTTRAELTANWFGGGEEESAGPGNDDDATGIAALALASMMGARRSPPPPPPSSSVSQQLPVAHPRPQTLAERQHPAILRHHRPSDPLPSFGGGQPHMHMAPPPPPVSTMSAFSPVPLRGSPMPPMSPSLSSSHMHSRPSSVGPSSHRHQSPGMPRSMAMSPPRGPSIGGVNMRQRKPSAPPMPASTAYAGRASISGYPPPHHQAPQYAERVAQLPPPIGLAHGAPARRLPYPMGSSPQMGSTRPGTAAPYSTEPSFGARYADSTTIPATAAPNQHHYQQQPRYNTPPPPLASGHTQPAAYHYPQPPMSPVNMHLPPPSGMRQYPLPGAATPNSSSRGYSAGPPPTQQPPQPSSSSSYHHH